MGLKAMGTPIPKSSGNPSGGGPSAPVPPSLGSGGIGPGGPTKGASWDSSKTQSMGMQKLKCGSIDLGKK